MKLSNNSKNKILGLLAMVMVVLFAYSVVGIMGVANRKEIAKLEEINRIAESREAKATQQRDSAMVRITKLTDEVRILKGQVQGQTQVLDRFEKSYENSMSELKYYRNEEKFVSGDVSDDVKYRFLSNYNYEKY